MDTAQLDRNETIVRQIRKLPSEDRRYIIGAAIMDLDRDLLKPNGPDRYAILLRLAEQATGHQLTKSRCRENTDIRILVATQMRSEGYGLYEIGRWMERDHSTVTYYTKMMEDALSLPVACPELIRKYDSFKKELLEYDKRNL